MALSSRGKTQSREKFTQQSLVQSIQLYYNSFISDYYIDGSNIIDIAKAGRRRWKIENNNSLKTKAYHFEHSFGHGKCHLSSFPTILILLAFLFHIILEQFDIYYQLLRKHLSTRKIFFDDIRVLTRYICFDNWKPLLRFMLENLEISIPKQE